MIANEIKDTYRGKQRMNLTVSGTFYYFYWWDQRFWQRRSRSIIVQFCATFTVETEIRTSKSFLKRNLYDLSQTCHSFFTLLRIGTLYQHLENSSCTQFVILRNVFRIQSFYLGQFYVSKWVCSKKDLFFHQQEVSVQCHCTCIAVFVLQALRVKRDACKRIWNTLECVDCVLLGKTQHFYTANYILNCKISTV